MGGSLEAPYSPMKGMEARESSSSGRGARFPFGLPEATSPVEPGAGAESLGSGENKEGSSPSKGRA